MSVIKQSHVLSIDKLLSELTFVNNVFTTGSIVSFPFDSYKLSVISTKPVRIHLVFHHEKNDLSIIDEDSITLQAGVYSYTVNVIKGSKMRISIHDNGQTFNATDSIFCNIYLSTNSNHLITI
mgnify:CR=1 FL=1|tara:strand:+ start:1042 stop:1410 length:369 start_codon:yes stop_codon:yes gene_type:complete